MAIDEQIGDTSDWGKMTPEERQADVDTLVEEQGEPETPEAEKTEDTDTTDDGDEIPADADAAGESDESPDEDEVADDWLDGETRDFASTMGLTEEDLKSFSSREELDRVVRIINRKAFETGKAALKKASDAGAPVIPPEQEPKKPAASDVFDDLTGFKFGDQFDDDVAKPHNDFVEAIVADLRSVRADIAGLLQQRQEEQASGLHRQAVQSLHSLGYKELFGEPGKPPTKLEAENIKKAVYAHTVHAAGLLTMGWDEVEPSPKFMDIAAHMEFGDQISKHAQRQRIEKLKKQSARITGGLSSKTSTGRKPGQSPLEAVNTDPEIDKIFNQLVSERSG